MDRSGALLVLSKRTNESPGSGAGREERHHVRPAKVSFRAHLSYGQLTYGKSVGSGGNQQISPCFLQDLQSEVDLPQMQRSYEGVKLPKC